MALLLYAISRNSIYGSAICAFNVTAVNKAFNGPFKSQNSINSIWETHPNTHKHFQVRKKTQFKNRRTAFVGGREIEDIIILIFV